MNEEENINENDDHSIDDTEALLRNEVSEVRGALETDENEDTPSISFFTLLRFASAKDKLCIFLATVTALTSGCSTAINTLLFSGFIQSMIDFGRSVNEGTPKVDAFLQATKTFAIYNSLVGVALVILTYIGTVLMNISAYNQVFRIRQAYLKAALHQDFEYFDTHQIGDFATQMSDNVVKIENGIGEKLEKFIFYTAEFLTCFMMALIKGWKLALLCLITFPVTMCLIWSSGWIASKLSKREAELSSKAGAVAEEVFSAIRTVYAFSGQQTEIDRFEKRISEARSVNIKKGLLEAISMGLLDFCIYSSYGLSLWFGYKLMIDEPKTYNVDTMIAVFFGIMLASVNFESSSSLMDTFGTATGAGAQIFKLIDNVPKINSELDRGVEFNNTVGNIVLDNVFFHYPSRPDVPVLKGVSLSVQRGQSVAIVGHSGCGKSTIIQLISRFYDVVDGSVAIDGIDIGDYSVKWIRRQIGLVSQEPVLFNTTVRENIRYGRENFWYESEDIAACDVEETAKLANAHDFIRKLPSGYDTLVGERGASLSGGQKQRIAIARAIIRDPGILLLDEATSALDASSEAKVQKALDRAREGRTTIIIAHRLSTIRNVDKIYVLKEGTIVESGSHDELMDKKDHYYDMVMLQSTPEATETVTGTAGDLKRTISLEQDKDEDEDFDAIVEEENLNPEEIVKVPFTQVIKLNAPEWKSITVACLCAVVMGLSTPLFALIIGDFIGILSNPDTDAVKAQVRIHALIFVGLGIITALATLVTGFLFSVAGEHLTARLRKLMFEKLLQQEIGYFDDKNNSTGSLCARLSGEAASVHAATGQRISTILESVGTLLFATAAAAYCEWRLGLLALSFVPPIFAFIYAEGKMVSEESTGIAKAMESSSKIAVEAVANVRTVASLGKEEFFVEEYARQLRPALHIAKRATHLRGLTYGLSRGIFNFVYSATLYYGGYLMVYHNVSYGLVIKTAETLIMGSTSAAGAFAYAPDFHKGLSAAGRIIQLLNRKSKITDPNLPATEDFRGSGNASLGRVLFKYPTRPSVKVLENFDLEIERGKTIALVGPSGCGKSTIIQLLERFYDPDEGIVAQNSIPLPMLRLADVRQTIGFVQQEPVLFDRTIAENIAYGDNTRPTSMEEIIDVAKQANIHEFITSLPLGYETNVGTKGTQLSGGQKQRIAIARALIRRPKILLLDEATSALDTESEKVVQEALDAAKAGRTCVMIAHRLSTVRDADAICVLSNGRVAERGTHAQLMQHKRLYYNLNRRGGYT
ncbi:ATP-dependent translocase ABCB1-like isoform X2 [Maniola jurtina]|uniref:ATP-dependent translocase ABCB1-like isoform X2 n=1 Tax=Maniola jurtina TaxID=191418 RepID=UPI001E68B94E|nr:ATP-dependent translocase ABCB1-like isoform X2 [Maniola jurtina]